MFISNYENEILTGSVLIDFSILSVNCDHLCFIYVKIFEKILSGGLEVSFSIRMITGHKFKKNLVWLPLLDILKNDNRAPV